METKPSSYQTTYNSYIHHPISLDERAELNKTIQEWKKFGLVTDGSGLLSVLTERFFYGG